MDITQLDTPSLLLRQDLLDRNIARMHDRLAGKGVALRPHVKTAKNIDVVQRLLAAGAHAITASTLKEADYFAEHGIKDILYAVGIVPAKVPHVAQLQKRGVRITVILDSVDAAHGLVQAAREQGVRIPVLIEIDCDDHRAGVLPDDPVLLEMAAILQQAESTELAGVMTHSGGSYSTPGEDAIRVVARRERQAILTAAQRLRDAGLPCPIVSVGSTPTALFGEDFSGITEVRAGVYVFFDLVMAGLGVCSVDDIAISVLTSVIGHQERKQQLLVDAGWMALSRDHGTASQPVDQGYGMVCDLQGKPISDLIVTAVNQEHGIVASRSGAPIDFAAFPVGTRLRILPNHACATAAQHTAYQVITGDSPAVLATWQRFTGW
jgi:D-serine deaminase-like pyridoxal phosphate-dependent protein